MKAAIIHQAGTIPAYEDMQEPVPQNENQLLITVKAASVKNLDKLRASGKHYASYTQFPAVVGIDGVGSLEDGTRVYAQGITGMIAEKALISKNNYIVLSDALDDVTAAALPNAVIGAAMALLFRAKIKKGDTVLINGATGVTGQIAVQIAKHYGASRVIATGRNQESLQKVSNLGADEIISLKEKDDVVIEKIKTIHKTTSIDIVIDYLWGNPIELVIKALKGSGGFTHPVRIVTVGSIAGENIQLGSSFLRSSAIEILGSGIGSLSQEEMQKFSSEVLPEMFELAAQGKLTIETETAELKDIATAWQKEVAPGKRLVICM